MLQAMRTNMKVILWITIIFFVLLIFLVWGADLQFGDGPQPNSIGVVNGTPLSALEYQQIVSSNRQQAAAIGQDLQPNDMLQIEEQAWNTLITRELLVQEANRRGFSARDSEVRSVLLNNPPDIITQDPNFRNPQGQFDLAFYRQTIQNPNVSEAFLLQLESYVRQTLPIQKLQELILTAAKVTEDELRRDWQLENETAKISYVLVRNNEMTISEDFSEAELSAYYEAHRDDYQVPAGVDLIYVTIPRTPTAADTATLIQEMHEFAEDARQGEAEKASEEESLSSTDFASLAQTFSDASNAEDGGLSAGYLTRAELSPAYTTALETLSPGEISKPFQEGGSYLILQLVDRKPGEDGEPTVQIRTLARTIVPSDSTLMATANLLQDVQTNARTAGLTEAAAQASLNLRVATDIPPDGIAPGLAAVPQVGTWGHLSPTGSLSRIYETNTAWFLVEVGEKSEAGIASLEEVRARVERALLEERRSEASRAIIDQVNGRLKLGESLESAATAESAEFDSPPEFSRSVGLSSIGKDYDVMGAAFSLQTGETSQPIKSLWGWVVLKVEERSSLDWTLFEAQKTQMYRAKQAQRENEIYNDFLLELRKNAKVEDYRT